jgi:putative ABC transport system permease protein
MVFASYDNVKRDFDLDTVKFFWFDADGSATNDEITESMALLAEKHTGETFGIAATLFPPRSGPPQVRLSTRQDIITGINNRADGMIWESSKLPLLTLLVTSLGIVNAIVASVRVRQWDMGIMRSLGLTRFALARLVVAEALLMGTVACLLSFGFGLMAGWCGAGISQYVSFFGGLNPSLVIPWAHIALAFAGTLLLCLLAAGWPAVAAGRAEPLRLLQAGRQASVA